MLYILNFSFTSFQEEDEEDWQGIFQATIQANSAEEAVEKCREALQREKEREDTDWLDGLERVYLDDIIEAEGFPKEPVFINVSKRSASDDISIFSALPGNADELFANYGYGDEDKEGEVEVFLEFGGQRPEEAKGAEVRNVPLSPHP